MPAWMGGGGGGVLNSFLKVCLYILFYPYLIFPFLFLITCEVTNLYFKLKLKIKKYSSSWKLESGTVMVQPPVW